MVTYDASKDRLPFHMLDSGCLEAGVDSCLICPLPRCVEDLIGDEPPPTPGEAARERLRASVERYRLRDTIARKRADAQNRWKTPAHLVERNNQFIEQVLEQGKPLKRVARECGVSPTAVRIALRRHVYQSTVEDQLEEG